jgi:hypothetical protein
LTLTSLSTLNAGTQMPSIIDNSISISLNSKFAKLGSLESLLGKTITKPFYLVKEVSYESQFDGAKDTL